MHCEWWRVKRHPSVDEVFIPTFECLKLETLCNLSNFSNATHPLLIGARVMHETWTVKTAVIRFSLIFIDRFPGDDALSLRVSSYRKIRFGFLPRPQQSVKVYRFMFFDSDLYVQELSHTKAVYQRWRVRFSPGSPLKAIQILFPRGLTETASIGLNYRL